MTLKRNLTSLTVAASLTAAALGPMTTVANADGWRGGPNYTHTRAEKRNWNHGWRGNRDRHRYADRRYQHDNTGKYIALGVGALMLGIIASDAARY